MKELTPCDWLRIITSRRITAQQIAELEDCDIKTARSIVIELNDGKHTKNTAYVCDTDAYLRKYRATTRKDELRLIYEDRRL